MEERRLFCSSRKNIRLNWRRDVDSSFVQDRILRIERWISEKKNADFRRITRRYRDGNRRNRREIGEERGTILRIYSSFCRNRRELDDGGKEK